MIIVSLCYIFFIFIPVLLKLEFTNYESAAVHYLKKKNVLYNCSDLNQLFPIAGLDWPERVVTMARIP